MRDILPGLTFSPKHPRSVVKLNARRGVLSIEPMRFLYPYEAKREAEAEEPNRCHHLRRGFGG